MKQRFTSFLEKQSHLMFFKKKSSLLPISDQGDKAPEVGAEVDHDKEIPTEDEEERDVQLIPRRRRSTPAFDISKAEKAKGKKPLVFDVVTDQARIRQAASSSSNPAMSNLIKKALLKFGEVESEHPHVIEMKPLTGMRGPSSSSPSSKLKAPPPVTAPASQRLPSSSEEPLTTALSSKGSAKKAAAEGIKKDMFDIAPVVTEPDSPSVSDGEEVEAVIAMECLTAVRCLFIKCTTFLSTSTRTHSVPLLVLVLFLVLLVLVLFLVLLVLTIGWRRPFEPSIGWRLIKIWHGLHSLLSSALFSTMPLSSFVLLQSFEDSCI